MNAPTDWTSALAILAAGLILGTLVVFMARRRKASAATKRRELEARRDALVEQLRALGDDAADEDRAWLEKETAEVLRALDRLPAAPSEPAPTPKPRSATAGFVWGVACTLAIGGIAWYASTFTNHDVADNATVDAQITQAKDAFARNDLMSAFEKTNAVLAKNPEEPRALTYNAVVRLSMGEVDKASSMLELATKQDPKLLDAWVALAQARLHAGQQKEAAAAIEAAIKEHPAEEKRIREVFAAMQKPATQLPADHPPLPGSEMTMPVAAGGTAQPIHITLSLDPSMSPRGGTIYVIARGNEGGHPVAVRRIDTNDFPVTLDFGAGDSMMGGALPEKIRIEARLDSDGDAGTTDPADPRAFAENVRGGAAIELKLARAN